ncbi:ATP-grasp domain-containing protein [Streptomyces sp. NBC_00647]|uniref:methyltransferase domain-containing protein n=1 Tax=Streptomyces sp. NBC_00647 TaxID=2975796 RepID=UPI0032510DA5
MSVPVLLLEAAGPESWALVRAAAAAGHRVHAVTDMATLATYPDELRQLLAGSLVTDFAQPERARADITSYGRRIGARALLTVNEYLTDLAARACADLALPGNDPEQASAARNKAAMAAAFEAARVTTPRTMTVATDAELQARFAAGDVVLPCVVKPADGAGSSGVTVVTNPAELEQAWRSARSAQVMYGLPRDERVLVQDHIPGREFSVESITQNGQSTHLCITRKHMTSGLHRVELGHSLPARLTPAAERAVLEQTDRAIAAVGVRNGATHTELIVSPGGRPSVLEIGARLGAGHIGILIQHALGIDPWHTLWDIALGRPVTKIPASRGYATVRFLTAPRPGRLISVTGLPELSPTVPAVHVRAAVGARVGPATSNRGRLGHVIITGDRPRTVDDQAEQLLRRITVAVDEEGAACSSGRPAHDARSHQVTSAVEFDRLFAREGVDNAFSKLVHRVDPHLPPGLGPFSFLCTGLLHHISEQLALHQGQVLADLGCGPGGLGLWLAGQARAALTGIDFSAVAITAARNRAAQLPVSAAFSVADLASLPLPDQSVDRALSLDALQYVPDRTTAAGEALRILKPGGRLVLTGWQPRIPGDERLPARHRHTDWHRVLRTAGFTDIHTADDPTWDTAYQEIYRQALAVPSERGTALAGLQGEARRRLPTANLLRRIAVTADRRQIVAG